MWVASKANSSSTSGVLVQKEPLTIECKLSIWKCLQAMENGELYKRQFYDTRERFSYKKRQKNILHEKSSVHKVFWREIIHKKLKETYDNSRNLRLEVRFKSYITIQTPVQFRMHKNNSFQVFRIYNPQASLHD